MQILLRAFLILLILTIAAALFIVLYKRMRPVRNAHFICPNCGAGAMGLPCEEGRSRSIFWQRWIAAWCSMSPVWDAQ